MSRARFIAGKNFEECNLWRWRFALKPIVNGPLAARGLQLATYRHRAFSEPFYLVVDTKSARCPIGYAETKAEALKMARGALLWPELDEYIAEFVTLSNEAEASTEALLATFRNRPEQPASEPSVKSGPSPRIPRRRQAIFDASGGKCHYCSTILTLDGRWHIEHKMPRALMGGNEPSNLVASCVPCNMKKRDRTDIEFIASRQAA